MVVKAYKWLLMYQIASPVYGTIWKIIGNLFFIYNSVHIVYKWEIPLKSVSLVSFHRNQGLNDD